MALNFPDSPFVGQIYSDATAGFSYVWDGTVWKSYYQSDQTPDGTVTPPKLSPGGPVWNTSGDLNVTGILTAANISVAGTITYDDVTNVDSVGVVTARSGIVVVGGGVSVAGGGIDVNGHTETDTLRVSGVSTFTNNINLNTGNLKVATDGIIKIGNSDQLELYYNGSIGQTIKSTGDLRILTNRLLLNNSANDEQLIEANQNGSVALYYDNSKKFETLGTGVTVTGQLSASAGVLAGFSTFTTIRFSDDAGDNTSTYATTIGPNYIIGFDVSSPYLEDKYLQFTPNGSNYILKNIGIGTTNPTSPLHVVGETSLNGSVYIKNGNVFTNGGFIDFNSTNESLRTLSIGEYNEDLRFYNPTFGTRGDWVFQSYLAGEVLRIKNGSGNIGIGTTVPTSKLTVNGNVLVSGISTFSQTINLTQVTETVVNEFNTTLAPSSGTLTIDTSTGTVFLGDLNASVTTWDFTNVPTANSKATTITLIINGDISQTYGSGCNVNGSAVSGGVKWPGNLEPTATANYDILTFTIVKDGAGTINVFGSSTTNFS